MSEGIGESAIDDILRVLEKCRRWLRRCRDWQKSAETHGLRSVEATRLAFLAATEVVVIPPADGIALDPLLRERGAARSAYGELTAAAQAVHNALAHASRTEEELAKTLASLKPMPCDAYVAPGEKKLKREQVADRARQRIGTLRRSLEAPPDLLAVDRLEAAVESVAHEVDAIRGEKKVRRNVNDPRDHWIYDQYINGVKLLKICQLLKFRAAKMGWGRISEPAGITLAMRRAAARWHIARPEHGQRSDDRPPGLR
jgi:hypothetical protein